MNRNEEKFLTYWTKTRDMGMLKFSLIHGGSWGVVTPTIIPLFDLKNKSVSELYLSSDFLIRLLTFSIVGVLIFGIGHWKVNEKRYKKLKAKLTENE